MCTDYMFLNTYIYIYIQEEPPRCCEYTDYTCIKVLGARLCVDL